ncbi:MAG: PQQ-binding-like beta-propeller repeat protein, partial [Planctomycetota bacterium]
ILPCMLLALLAVTPTLSADWNRFRGPNGNGIVAESAVPSEWSSQKNLRWRTELPGSGTSSPVISGDRVYLTCYTGYGLDSGNPGNPEDLVRHLIAFDRGTGKEVWRRSVPGTKNEDPFRGFILQHGYASSTPVVDGNRVIALMGKSGLFAFDRDGQQLWQVDLGQESDPAKWGDATSPVVIDGVVIVDAAVLGHQLMGIDVATGETIWTISDDSYTNAWATPAEIQSNGKSIALIHIPKKVLAIDPKSGQTVWTCTSPLQDSACGSIVTRDGIAYLMGSRVGQGMAVRCDGNGDVSESKVVWQRQIRSGITTPLIVGERMYWTSSGIFLCANLADGEYAYRTRLPRKGGPTGGFPNADYSSAIAAGERIFQFTRNGESYVVKAGDSFEVVAHNAPFDDDTSAFSSTPAIDGDQLFIRSEKYLYCIGDAAK